MLAVLITSLTFVEAHQINAGHTAATDGIHGLADGVAADVLREVVECAGGKDRQRKPRIDGDRRGGGHRAVAAAHRQHLGPGGGAAHHLLGVIVGTEFHDLCLRQLGTHLVDDASAGAAARRRIDHQDHAGAIGPFRRLDAQRFRLWQSGFDDRRDQPPAQDGDPGADAEPRDDITGVVRAGCHSRQSDQAGQ